MPLHPHVLFIRSCFYTVENSLFLIWDLFSELFVRFYVFFQLRSVLGDRQLDLLVRGTPATREIQENVLAGRFSE